MQDARSEELGRIMDMMMPDPYPKTKKNLDNLLDILFGSGDNEYKISSMVKYAQEHGLERYPGRNRLEHKNYILRECHKK